MPRSNGPYPATFRQLMVDLVRAGRSPEALAKEFEPAAHAIRNWVKQADLDQGTREAGLRAEERPKLRRLRRAEQTAQDGLGDRGKGRGLVRPGDLALPGSSRS